MAERRGSMRERVAGRFASSISTGILPKSRAFPLSPAFLFKLLPLILLAFPLDGCLVCPMPVCTTNVRKRKARRMKNDRLKAAKIAAKAKS